MARKKTPTSPVHGKVFWVDTKMRNWTRAQLVQLITARGGVMQTGIDANLDYLVLADDRRATPGRSQAEKAAAKLTGAHFTTVYAHDLYALLIPQRAEALALLGSGPGTKDAWEACIPPYSCPVNIDLAGADLSGLDLSGFRFHKVDLTGVQVAGTILKGAWIGAVSKVDFRPVGAHEGLTISSGEDCTFDGLDLSKTTFHGTMTRCTFLGTALREALLGGSAWTQCDLTGADATGARSHGWRAVDLVAAQANFTRASFTYGHFEKGNFSAATFLDADLSHTTFDGADLRGANLQRVSLVHAKLTSADLRKADLRSANLVEADLTGANLTGADFTGANLRDAKLPATTKGVKGITATSTSGATAGPLLTQLVAKLAAGSGNLEFGFVLEDPTAGRVACRLERRYRTHHYLRLTDAAGDRQLSPKDAETALLDLATLYPGAVPLVDTLLVKPTTLSKSVEVLAVQALCELFGQPIPEAQDLQKAKKAAKSQATTTRAAIMTALRDGSESVAAWNARSDAERKLVGEFKGADLSGARLEGINLQRINAPGVNFAGADLRKADLFDAKLKKANFAKADLREARLHYAGAQEIDAAQADLRGADLQRGRFQRANFTGANLRGASLSHGNFEGADFTGADLTDAHTNSSTYDSDTKFPIGYTPDTGWKFTGTGARPTALVVAAPPKESLDFAAFFAKLPSVTDPGRIKNAVSMLKAERFSLFAEVGSDAVVGVVRSQSSAERVYSCRLASSGLFECGTQNLRICGGLQGMVCKHLLVMILGLTKAGTLDSGDAYQWLQMARKQSPTFDKEAMTATFLKYKGVEAGEVDWRPTETVPEDYYAL